MREHLPLSAELRVGGRRFVSVRAGDGPLGAQPLVVGEVVYLTDLNFAAEGAEAAVAEAGTDAVIMVV